MSAFALVGGGEELVSGLMHSIMFCTSIHDLLSIQPIQGWLVVVSLLMNAATKFLLLCALVISELRCALMANEAWVVLETLQEGGALSNCKPVSLCHCEKAHWFTVLELLRPQLIVVYYSYSVLRVKITWLSRSVSDSILGHFLPSSLLMITEIWPQFLYLIIFRGGRNLTIITNPLDSFLG